MPRPTPLLLVLAREALGLNQQKLADLAGSSLRTVQRWENGRAKPSSWHIHPLADAVRTADPQLAAELDELAPRPAPPVPLVVVSASPTLPPPPPSPLPSPAPAPAPVSAPIADDILVDAVVCAAAEAMAMTPQAVRPAIHAAFARARDARLTIEAVLAVLAASITRA
jgi:DNA-binding XRE family transcriptional regulator